jgi:hypothetical protein
MHRSLLRPRAVLIGIILGSGFLLLPAWTLDTSGGNQPPPAGNKLETKSPLELACQARGFLKTYCSQCHHGPDPEVDDYDVLDYKSLTKKRTDGDTPWYYVAPGVKGEAALKESILWSRAGKKGVADAEQDMPPRSAKKHPGEELRNTVLRQWLEAGAPEWPAEKVVEVDEKTQTWYRVKKLLTDRCLKCHSGEGNVPDFTITDYDSLTKKRTKRDPDDYPIEWDKLPWTYVQPGKSDESLLYHVLKDNAMPKAGSKFTDEEKSLIRNWIDSGASGPPTVEKRPFLAEKDQLRAINAYLEKMPKDGRAGLRFFTFTHLHNNQSIHAKDLQFHKAALSKLLNSLTWKPKLVLPAAVPGTQDTVFAIHLTDFGWSADTWGQVIKTYPYALDFGDVSKAVAQHTATPIAVVRADWFTEHASQPTLYHILLDLPESAAALEKHLGIDFADNFRKGKLVRAGYLGASTTTSSYRVVERQEITKISKGGYWKSYDFGQNNFKANPLQFPLGPKMPNHPTPHLAFEHQGGEIIFRLPNGLQGYLATTGTGERVDAPPIDVLRDTQQFSGTPLIKNGISCMGCHAQGMNDVSDQVLRLAKPGASKVNPDDAEAITRIYLPKKDMDVFINKDRDVFLQSLDQVTRPFLQIPGSCDTLEPLDELIFGFCSDYRLPLGKDQVAWELGYTDWEALDKVFQAKPDVWKGLKIRGRLESKYRVSRQEWEHLFHEAAQRLQLGQPILISAKPKE